MADDNSIEIKFSVDCGDLGSTISEAMNKLVSAVQDASAKTQTATQNMGNSVAGAASQIQAATESMGHSVASAAAKINAATTHMGGSVAEAGEKTKKTEGSFGEAFEKIKEKVSGGVEAIAGALGKVTGLLEGFGAILKGGEAFGECIQATVKYAKELKDLSEKLGITKTAAANLSTALKLSGSSSEVYLKGVKYLGEQSRESEKELNKLGLKVRDGNHQFLDQKDLVNAALKSLDTYKTGVDQNMAAQKYFHMSMDDVNKTYRISAEVSAEAERLTKAYGLANDEASGSVKDYKMSLAAIEIAVEAIKDAVGKALMPILTDLGNWFRNEGPSAVSAVIEIIEGLGETLRIVAELGTEFYDDMVEVFTETGRAIGEVFGDTIPGDVDILANSMKVIQILALGFKLGVVMVFEVIRAYLLVLVAEWKRWAEIAKAAMNLDWDGMKAACREGTKKVESVLTESGARMIKAAQETRAQMDKIAMAAPKEGKAADGKPPESKGRRRFPGDDEKEGGGKKESKVQQWEKELEEKKQKILQEAEANNNFREMTLAEEAKFWSEKFALHAVKGEELFQLNKKLLAAERGARKQSFDEKMAEEDKEIAAVKTDLGKKLVLALRHSHEIGLVYDEDSKQYKAAREKVAEIETAIQAQMAKIKQNAMDNDRAQRLWMIDQEAADAKAEVELGQMTAEELLRQEVAFENRRNAIRLEALQERLRIANADNNRAEVSAVNGEIEALERQHKAKLSEIARQTTKEQQAPMQAFLSTSKNAFEQFLTGVLTKTKSLRDGLRDLWKQMSQSFIQEFVVKKTMAIITQNAKELASQSAFLSELFGLQKVSSDKTVATKTTEASQVSASNGMEAGTGALAAMASIPYVGPILAIAAMGTIMAAVSSLTGGTKSASGGYDIPSGVNPLTQLHAEEMVLPAEHANTIRSMKDGGGAGGGMTVHLNVSAVDGASVKRFLSDNKHHVAAAVSDAVRNGYRPANANTRGRLG